MRLFQISNQKQIMQYFVSVSQEKGTKTKVKVISFRLEHNLFAGSRLISYQDDFLFVKIGTNFIIDKTTITLKYYYIAISDVLI